MAEAYNTVRPHNSLGYCPQYLLQCWSSLPALNRLDYHKDWYILRGSSHLPSLVFSYNLREGLNIGGSSNNILSGFYDFDNGKVLFIAISEQLDVTEYYDGVD